MSAERRKVLEMLEAGKISAEEAERLLNRLSPSDDPESAAMGESSGAVDGAETGRQPKGLRFLRVVVDSPGRDSVNIRLPLGLVRTGLKLSTLLPGKVSHRLSERGIDLSNLGRLNDEALIAELADLQVDIADAGGEKVRIFCE